MKGRFYLLLLFALPTACLHAATVAPTSGPTAGQTDITIVATGGDDFEAQGAMSSVMVGSNAAAVITTWNAGLIIFKLPEGVGAGLQVKVTTQSGAIIICSDLFDYNAPLLFALSPASGPAAGGTTVIATGNHFGPPGTSATVLIDNAPATNVVVTSHTSLTFVTPPGAGINNSAVIIIQGQSSMSAPLWSYNPPSVSSAFPASGPTIGGTLVTLTGDNFGPPGTIATVTVGGAPGSSVSVINNSTITFLSPAGTGISKNIIVTVEAQSSIPVPLWSYNPPLAVSSSPSSGPTTGGTMVTLTGNNFGPAGTMASVTIDGVSCTEVVVTGHTILTFKTPAGAGINQNVIVTVAGQSSAPAPIWSYAAPVLTSLTPSQGPTNGGTFVTAIGNNFGLPGTPASVTIDGALATNVTVTSHTTLTFLSPPGSGVNNDVVVTIENQPSLPVPLWSFQGPTIASVFPQEGPTQGGTSVTLTGQNFGPAGTLATVTIDGVPGTSVVVLGHTSLTFTTPMGAGINQEVVVNVDGQSSPPVPIWDYAAPVLFGLSPLTGPTIGGTIVSATGINFGPPGSNISVTVDGTPSPMVNYSSHTSLSFVTPAGSGAINPVIITVEGQGSNSFNFTYAAPIVNNLTPNSGPEEGGTPVSIFGENFGQPVIPISVLIDNVPVQDLMHVSHSLITFTTPPGMGADRPVQITIDGQQVTPSPTFSYLAPLPEGVGIGTNNPHESAALDITSDSRGILIPRLTTAEREDIGSPAAGLLVYDSTLNAFFFFNGTVWKQLSMQ
jgi:hypothetical protein